MVKADKENGRIVVGIDILDLDDYLKTLRSLARIISDRDKNMDADCVEDVALLLEYMIPTGDEVKEIIKAGIS